MEKVNNQLCIGNESGLFVTCWLGILTFSTGELRFVNAGHPYPLLCKSGEVSFLQEKSGLVLGYMENLPYKEHCLRLEKGDRIFIYSDGITEATNKDEELFRFALKDKLHQPYREKLIPGLSEIINNTPIVNFDGDFIPENNYLICGDNLSFKISL